MNPFRNTKSSQPKVKPAPQKRVGTSTGFMPNAKIKMPKVKKPSAHEILEHGTPGDNQNFNK